MFGSLANNTETSVLLLADTLMNQAEKRILSSKPWPFLEKQYTVNTDSTAQFVSIPMYVDRAESVYVTIGSQRYAPLECPSRQLWDMLNQTTYTSDIPEYFFIYDGKIGLYPAPASSGNVITVNGKLLAKDLSIADYTTGTVSAVTNGATTVTGSGTTWTSQMAGRWLRITDSDTANTGDGHWYQILSVASTTSLTLVRAYAGTTITAGAADYVIAQCSLLPEAYHLLPVYEALKIYFTSVDPETDRGDRYGNEAEKMLSQLSADHGSKSQSVIIDEGYCYEEII